MEDRQLKEELFKEIKRRGLLEQEDDSEEDIEETEDEDGELYKLPSKLEEVVIVNSTFLPWACILSKYFWNLPIKPSILSFTDCKINSPIDADLDSGPNPPSCEAGSEV